MGGVCVHTVTEFGLSHPKDGLTWNVCLCNSHQEIKGQKP